MKSRFLFFWIFSFILWDASGFAGQKIAVTGQMSGYLAMPENPAEKIPAILLIHEWWGLNDQIKGLADEFASNGFAALAVDLYRGDATDDPMKAHELMRGLPDGRVIRDLKSAMDFLQKNPSIDSKKIGVIGWCMGGGYALSFALEDSRVQALVMYYGKLVTDNKKLEPLKAPLLGFFGEEDRGIPPDTVKDFEYRLNQLGKRAEIHLVPNAGHAFANPNNKEGYRPEAAKDAWQKTLIFFKSNLI